jgi:hypothetical protein
MCNLHGSENECRRCAECNGPSKLGEQTETDAAAANICQEDLSHPHKRWCVYRLKNENVDGNYQHASCKPGLVVASQVLRLQDAFDDEDQSKVWKARYCERKRQFGLELSTWRPLSDTHEAASDDQPCQPGVS